GRQLTARHTSERGRGGGSAPPTGIAGLFYSTGDHGVPFPFECDINRASPANLRSKESTMSLSRREFLAASTVVAAGATILPASAQGANEKIRVATIGVQNRGRAHIAGLL